VTRARDAEGTVLIDFRVEQEDSVYPMVPAGADLHAMIRRPERNVLAVSRTQHGIVRHCYIDADFVQSGDYGQIQRTAQVLQGLLGEGAYVKRGAEQQAVREFREAIEWLLAEVKRGVGIQRYKGLGEMNPEQLWETTMDPTKRTLLRVVVPDRYQAKTKSAARETAELVESLMGRKPELRFAFIQENAKFVRDLDV